MITGVSFRLWASSGAISCHSREVGWCVEAIIGRCAAKASHRIKMKYRSATKDAIDPIVDTTFHMV